MLNVLPDALVAEITWDHNTDLYRFGENERPATMLLASVIDERGNELRARAELDHDFNGDVTNFDDAISDCMEDLAYEHRVAAEQCVECNGEQVLLVGGFGDSRPCPSCTPCRRDEDDDARDAL